MSPKMSRLMWGTLLGSCLIAAFTLSSSRAQNGVAQSPDKLIPKDALLFIRWDGTKAHAQAFSETAAHEALYESGLMPVLEKAFNGIASQPGPAGSILDGPAGQALGHIKDNGVRLAVALAAPGTERSTDAAALFSRRVSHRPGNSFGSAWPGSIDTAGTDASQVESSGDRRASDQHVRDPGFARHRTWLVGGRRAL